MKGKAESMYRLVFVLLLSILAGCTAEQPAENINIIELNFPAELAVTRRAQWGWEPITQSHAEHTVTRITIHHGGVDFPDDKNVVKYLRALQSWGRSDKDWIDIPYHFMIDRQGQVYEARPINFPGDTNTTYDPAGHALVAVMGNYENQSLSQVQLDALITMTAFLADEYDVPIEDIRGHKDYADTTCPGAEIYRYLLDGTIHVGVTAILEQTEP